MSWLFCTVFLTFGYLPVNTVTIQDNYIPPVIYATADNAGSFEQTVGFSATAFKVFTVWTEIETFDKIDSDGFAPFRSDYRIGFNLHRGPVEVGFTHECDHPVIYSMQKQKLGYGGNKTEIYAKFTLEFGEK